MRIELQPHRAVLLFAAGTVFAVAAAALLLAWDMRVRALEQSRLDTVAVAYMLREQTDRAFQGVDAGIRGVLERMQSSYGAGLALDDDAVHLMLRTRSFGTPHLKALSIVDVEGVIRNSSRAPLQGSELAAALPLFKAFRAGGAGDLYVDEPARDPADGSWAITLARPLIDGHGRLRGMVAATMEIPRFDQFYRWLQLQHARPMALYLEDGTLLASSPHRESVIGEAASELRNLRLPLDDSQIRMMTDARPDGTADSLALGKVGAYPLLVSVTDDRMQALAAWRERLVPIALGATLVCVFIGAAGMLLSRELARRAALSQALSAADRRYHLTVDSLEDACVAVDATQNIVLFNPAAEDMFGISREEAVGHPLSRILPEGVIDAHAGFIRRFAASGLAAAGMSPKRDVIGVRRDGIQFPMEITVSRTGEGPGQQFTAIIRDMTQRRQAESELRRMNQQLRALSAAMQDVREQERARIASELHDELGQRLTGIKLELSWLAGRARDGAMEAPSLNPVRRHVDEAITSVRRIATELRPLVLDELGLREALAWMAAEYGRSSGMSVRLHVPEADLVDADGLRIALFRMVQEGLTNVVRHAHATEAEVQLLRVGGSLVLRVEDNGLGFARDQSSGGFGLLGIRERAMAFGGEMRLAPRDGGGTVLEVVLPSPCRMPDDASAVREPS